VDHARSVRWRDRGSRGCGGLVVACVQFGPDGQAGLGYCGGDGLKDDLVAGQRPPRQFA
jgi:hypothetical protein